LGEGGHVATASWIAAPWIGALVLLRLNDRLFDRVDDRTGTVEAVSLHSTTLRTPDGLTLTMPDQAVLEGAAVNLSVTGKRRLTVPVDVGPEHLDDARYVIRQASEADDHLVDEPEPVAFVDASLDDGVRFVARCWVEADHCGDHCRPTALRRILDHRHAEGIATATAQTVPVRDR
jgi:small-conductance mechanosensitive channel